jgi:penicillin-binding protein 2
MYAIRLKSVLAVLAIGAAVLLVFLLRLQVFQETRYRQEAAERLKRPPGFHPTIRGTIYDRNGVPLAQDTGAFDVAIYFPFVELSDEFVADLARQWSVPKADVRLRVQRMWQELARLTNVPPEELARRAEIIRQRVRVIRETVAERHGRRIPVREETYGPRTSIPHPIVHDVDLSAVGVIGSQPDRFPGLVLVPTSKREYPYGAVAPHVVGWLGEVTQEELDGAVNADYPPGHLKRCWPGDEVGRSGVEALAESILRGSRGVYRKGIDGNFLEDISAVPGGDVHLSLDIALQADIEAILDRGPPDAPRRRVVGAVVVLDCRTGEVLVLATSPRYDVRLVEADYPDLLRDPAGPLLNRAAAGQYPLGSVFKAVTSTAALHEGVLTPQTILTCEGILDRDHPERFRCHIYPSGHGAIELRTAIKKSCNVFFYQVGMLLGRQAGGGRDLALARDRLIQWAERMGFGHPTGIGLPGEASGSVKVGDVRNLAVGQGELLVTPLQVAQIYGLVASDGRMPPLRLVRELAPPADAARPGLNLNPKYMAVIRDAFDAVVNEEGGTGYGRANLPDIRIAGKTGTAQAGRGADHAWFAGFAPAENPRIAFSVIIEHGGHGGETAGPIAREIIKACKTHGYLDDRPPPQEIKPEPPPNDPPPKAVG